MIPKHENTACVHFEGGIMRRLSVAALCCLCSLTAHITNGSPGGEPIAEQAARILAARCLECHSGAEPQGELDLSRRSTATAGRSAGPALTAGSLDASRLWQVITAGEMPPEDAVPLNDQQRGILRRWILAGAPYPTDPIDRFAYSTPERAGYDWWALQPVERPPIPEAEAFPTAAAAQSEAARTAWRRNSIDAFVGARLHQAGLSPSEEAEPRVLVRRLFFDLIGLPPTPQQMDAFLADSSDEAYSQLVEQLLASSHYGERWARHWLDVARFGESDGFERNFVRENLWHYRDWLIRAFNNDMPYDQFARKQVAGDLLTPGREGLAGAAFLTAGVHNTVVGGSEFMKKTARQDELEEIAGTVAQTFVGLTVNCARCHDHKFDPISQAEYYGFVAALSGVYHGEKEFRNPQIDAEVERTKAQLQQLQREIQQIDEPIRTRLLEARAAAGSTGPAPPEPRVAWECCPAGSLGRRRRVGCR